jgi:hypothetical protein
MKSVQHEADLRAWVQFGKWAPGLVSGKAAGHLLVFMVRKLIPDMTNWLLFVGETEIVSDFGHSEDDGLIFCGRQRFHRLHLEMSGKTELWKITLQNFCVPGCKQDQFDCPLKYTPRNGYLKC